MFVPSRHPFLVKMQGVLRPDASELAEIDRLKRKVLRKKSGDAILLEGQGNRSGYLLLSGWACTIRHLTNGSSQIIDFRLPGDFIGTGELLLQHSAQGCEAITPVEMCEVTPEDLQLTALRAPSVGAAVMWASARDRAILAEHMVNLGRRNPQVRTAHLLLELSARLSYVGLGTPDRFDCPLSQYLLADALGLTAVHMNRVLRKLREDGLVSFRRSVVTIHDRPRMIEFAGFDPDYLDHTETAGAASPLRRLATLGQSFGEAADHARCAVPRKTTASPRHNAFARRS